VSVDAVRQRQRLLHELNDSIADVTTTWEQSRSHFLCECGQLDCQATMFEALRSNDGLFFVAKGHLLADIDELVESRDGYDVVRMKS